MPDTIQAGTEAPAASAPTTMGAGKCLTVCATCPWRTSNHGKPHPEKWYATANLRRLWDGLRRGEAPGMICHSTDPDSIHYGGEKAVRPGHERHCAGALILIQTEMDALKDAPSLRAYQQARHKPLTRDGGAAWAWRILTVLGGTSFRVDDAEAVGLPWRQAKPEGGAPDA